MAVSLLDLHALAEHALGASASPVQTCRDLASVGNLAVDLSRTGCPLERLRAWDLANTCGQLARAYLSAVAGR